VTIEAPTEEQPVKVADTEVGDAAGVSLVSDNNDDKKMEEGEWQRVKRRNRSQSTGSSAPRSRTDSDSSTSSVVNRGRGRPKKKSLVFETISNREKTLSPAVSHELLDVEIL
jgi:hypothetical protein